MSRRWTDDERRALFQLDKTDKQLATELDRTVSAIHNERSQLIAHGSEFCPPDWPGKMPPTPEPFFRGRDGFGFVLGLAAQTDRQNADPARFKS